MVRFLFIALGLAVFPAQGFAQFAGVPNLVAAVGPAAPTEDPALDAVKAAFADLIDYLKATETSDVAVIETKAKTIEDEANKVVADTALSGDTRETAYVYSLQAYIVAFSYDRTKFEPKLKSVIGECKANFPGGSMAAAGDALLIQLDFATLDVAGLVARLQTYIKDYPKSTYGPALIVAYAKAYHVSDLKKATEAVTEGLKLFPANIELLQFEKLLLKVGKPVTLTGPAIDGSTFDISAWKGKVVVVDFWATWCPPCRAISPKLQEMYDDLHAKGVEIVGVSLDDDKAELESYVSDHSIAWTQIFFDELADRNQIARDWGVSGIPTLFVVDKDGNLMQLGVHDYESVRDAVEEALKTR